MTVTRNRHGEGETPAHASARGSVREPSDDARGSAPGVPESRRDAGETGNQGRGFAEDVYEFLGSVRFTMLVLSLIAAACIVGTLVQQQASPEEYLARYSEATYASLRFLGLTDVFHSPWFFLLVGLFVLNLVLCTARRLRAFLKSRGRAGVPGEEALASMSRAGAPGFFVPGARIDDTARLFRGYRETARDGSGRVLEKGSLSRYGVYVIHTSILVILAGGLIGLVFGYRGSLILSKGDIKDTVVKRGPARGPVPLGFAIECRNVELEKYPSGEPKEYRTVIRILETGKPVREGVVRVNHPLTHKGTSIYQAGFASDPSLLFDIGGKEVRLSQGGVYKTGRLAMMVMRSEESVHDFGPGAQVVYLDGDEPKAVWFLKDVPKMNEKEIMGVDVRLKEVAEDYSTSLQISRDPGVRVVWAGFAMILFGLCINFFMHHRRVYLRQTPEGVRVAGASPRNREAFKKELDKWGERANGLKRKG